MNHGIYGNPMVFAEFTLQGPFSVRAWKRAFFVSFIDLRLKRAVKIEASAKKINKTNNALFHACSGNGPLLSKDAN